MGKNSKKGATAVVGALTLAAIVAATQSDTGFLFASAEAAAPFIAAGHAEQNTGMTNPANATEFATRATAEGINSLTTSTAPATPAPATAPAKPVFTIETITAPVTKRRGGGGVTIYPFDDLPAPTTGADGKPQVAAFFVPATAEKPEPWKSLQSAVSAASRRYATKTGETSFIKGDGTAGVRASYDYDRKFGITEGDRNGVKGAWVSRTK